MPSKPRHGRDYRKRTPRNTDLVQAPGATNGFVNITAVNMTNDTQVTIDFDAPAVGVAAPQNFFITTQAVTADMISSPTAGAAEGVAIAVEQSNVPPSQGRITVDFDGGSIPGGVIDPATMYLFVAATAQESALFAGRLLNAAPHGQLLVIDVP